MQLYIHVPFCKCRCAYCDFYSTTCADLTGAYVGALCREIKSQEHHTLSTLYLGGGTPSQLCPTELSSIFETLRTHFTIAPDAEITIEVNPDDLTDALCQHIVSLGINRVSMGVQSFCDAELRFINRRHTAEQAVDAVERLREAGISNVSIDLIYGLPGQTLESFTQSLHTALRLPIQHLSSYALSIEPGTPLSRLLEQGEINEVDEELSRQMYYLMKDKCCEAGFEHYEISNFARPGHQSRHNSSYWSGLPYLGLGPGACGYDGHRRRYNNTPDLQSYIHTNVVPQTIEILNDRECVNEIIFTRLRTKRGLSLSEIPDEFREELLVSAGPHLHIGNLCLVENEILRLTDRGLFVSNDIMSDLMFVE